MRKTLLLLAFGLTTVGAPQTASAQMWFDAEYLFWGRTNDSDQSYINGAANSGDVDFDFANGVRLTLGGGFGDYELEASFAQIDNWNGDSRGAFALPIAFDNTSLNALVFPAGAGTLAFNSGLAIAATQGAEANEAEFLTAGSLLTHSYTTKLRDVQINFGSNRELNWLRWGVGYRELTIDENGGFGVSGTFDARDLDDGATIGFVGNDPNDGLDDGSLTTAGFVNTAGGGDGFDSIDAFTPTIDRLAVLFNGTTENRLDGVQLSLAARTAPSDIFMLEAFTRVGLYYNRINGTVNELLVGSGDDDSVYYRSLGDSTAKASFGFNPGVRGALHLTDYISLTAGYEFLVVSGVGLGPDQLAQVQTNILGASAYEVDASGLFVGHGGNLGVEVRW